MKRLIDANALKKEVALMFGDKTHITESVCELIDNASPVKAFTEEDMAGAYNEGYACGSRESKRPQGEWIIVKDKKWGDNVKCPFCGKELAGTDLNFCCKCGAKLSGSEKMNRGAEND